MSAAGKPKVFMWAVPRSISTAFFRAMMSKPNIKVFMEPYSYPYHWGPERKSSRFENDPTREECTFMNVKKEIEQEYPGDAVFVKDMAYYLGNDILTTELLPEGYVHTFIVRDPKKSIYSLYKMSVNKALTGWDYFDPEEAGFKELYQVFRLVTEELGQEAIVIDADDLLQHPEDILRQYCHKVGIGFDPKMLNWDEIDPENMKSFEDWVPWVEDALTSTCFQPSATKPKSPQVMPDVPRHVQKAMDDNMLFYNELHAQRLKPNSLKI